MAISLENRKPLNPNSSNDPDNLEPLLSNLQGNILKSHGREFVNLILIKFTCKQVDARSWLRNFGAWVTPATEQFATVARYKATGKKSLDRFTNFFLTAGGYKAIDIEDENQLPRDKKFQEGMKALKLDDYSRDNWEGFYKDDIHAMVLLAHEVSSALEDDTNYVDESLQGIAATKVQRGHVLRNDAGKPIEHFGFVDGRSQPIFLEEDLKQEEEDWDGTRYYNPLAPLKLVLDKDPNGGHNGYGSYLVYRKLEQNVRGFKERVREESRENALPTKRSVADEIGLSPKDRKRVGAMVMGRFENGAPLAISERDQLAGSPNNFNYDDDPNGLRCPLASHIRKVNPRDKNILDHRIVRRGIPYNDLGREVHPAKTAPEEMPTEGVGLLFMCFQRSIEDQFEYISHLANDPDRPVIGAGVDLLVGRSDSKQAYSQIWPKEWGKPTKLDGQFGDYVTLKGGEYFFAPSLPFLRNL